jgi:dipeptidyl aminopeptidase/acylaminoacyl peptidase
MALVTGGMWLAAESDAVFPGLNGRISFSSVSGGSGDLFTIAPDGSSGWQRLTSDPADDAQSAWSPDGSRVAFRSRRDGNYEVYVMESDGSRQTRLTTTPPPMFSTQPSWSPDGERLLFRSSRDGDPELWIMSRDGSDPQQLTQHPADERYPGFSLDGRQIVFISDRDGDFEIYVMDPSGSNVRQLTDNSVLDTGPAWSPDGTQIAFASERDGKGEIYVMNVDGSNQRRLTFNGAQDTGPAFSPDGAKIAFTSERDANAEIYVMNADGSAQTRLTNASTLEQSPDWQALPPSQGQPSARPSPLPNSQSVSTPPKGARDRRAPRIALRVRRRQRALARGAVMIRISCDEPCKVTASGRLERPRRRKALRLKTARKTLQAGREARLRLRPTRRTRHAMRAVLSRRGVVRVRVAILARDASGNVRSAKRRVGIRK